MSKWINLKEAERAISEGDGSGISIAVIDSGIDVTQPQLIGTTLVDDLAVVPAGPTLRVIPGEGSDAYGHGTAVAGIIRQLAPKCLLGSIRVLTGAYLQSKTVIIQRGVQEALDRDYNILNCSFGCPLQSQVLEYKSWVDAAYLKGVHITAACSNEDFRTPEWPAYFPSVIAVNMAETEENRFYYRSGTLVEFVAQGVDVKVPWSDGKEKVVTGSSFAAPRLAGLLARLLSVYPDLSPLHAKAILHKIAKPWRPSPEMKKWPS